MRPSVSWKWIVLWSLWATRLAHVPTQPVRVTGGMLRGFIAPDGSHAAYLAMPYATVTDRFQAPGPEPTWKGVYEAINENIICTQSFLDTIVIGQEDCLVLNVYTPLNANSDSLLPVMFFIHGGGFFFGSGSPIVYGPEYLVSKGVVLVTFNYRLNVQGFLCLGIKEAPGNAGMKDQVAALKWVQRNIRVFGGDPDNVTIFGESAGGSSVSYHVLSLMSKDLFHKAILQSGSSIAAWSHQFRPVYIASMLAKTMGYNSQDPQEIYNYLNSKSSAELVTTQVPRREGSLSLSRSLFVPCAEQVIDGVEAFITDIPYKLFANGKYTKVPMIIGTNNEEGFYFAALENDTTIGKIQFNKSLPKDLVLPSDSERKMIANTLQRFYMGNDEISMETWINLSKLHGELYFQYPAMEETELILKTNDKPLYNYLFRYSGWRNIPKFTLGFPFASTRGASHADDLFYLFKQYFLGVFFEGKMVDRMTTLWTNFAKYGDPAPEVTDLIPVKWLPTDSGNPQAFVIDEKLTTAPLWHSESLLYLRQIYAKYRRIRN